MSARKVRQFKKRFRILRHWSIGYRRATTEMNSCVHINPRSNKATIYGYRGDLPNDYFLHESLHCAMRALLRMDKRKPKELRIAEEKLIQDICREWRRKP